MEKHIVLVPIEISNARNICEHINGKTYKSFAIIGGVRNEDEQHLIKDICYYTLNEFVGLFNDQELNNLTNYFISFVNIA